MVSVARTRKSERHHLRRSRCRIRTHPSDSLPQSSSTTDGARLSGSAPRWSHCGRSLVSHGQRYTGGTSLGSANPSLILFSRTANLHQTPHRTADSPPSSAPFPGPESSVSKETLALTLSYFCFGYVAWVFFGWFYIYLAQARGLNLKTSAVYSMLPFRGNDNRLSGRWRRQRLDRPSFQSASRKVSPSSLLHGTHCSSSGSGL